MIAFGIVTVVRRRRLAANAVRRRRFWEAKDIHAAVSAFDYGVLGWVFVALGLLGLLMRSVA
jgi:hypothetical protein